MRSLLTSLCHGCYSGASHDQWEGITFVQLKILYYHMLPYPIPIQLYKHTDMIYWWKSQDTFLHFIKTDCSRFIWIPYGGWHFDPNHAKWLLRHINRFMCDSFETMFRLTFMSLNSFVLVVNIWIMNWHELIHFCKLFGNWRMWRNCVQKGSLGTGELGSKWASVWRVHFASRDPCER